ncbi:MAG: DUF5685 family protein, partial [Clostridia bacterium]
MFGYVKPMKCELKVRDYEHYRAVYCGLCNELKREYGIRARFIINYDFTFLAIVLASVEGTSREYEYKRCIASPCKKKCACASSQATKNAAAASVILAWYKLNDSVVDDGKISARVAMLFLRRAYKKASSTLMEFADVTREKLGALRELEIAGECSIDRVADTFATILAKLSDYADANTRALREMFYHLGRVIYILDALADIDEDAKSGNYNPVVARYGIKEGEIPQDVREQVVFT